MNMTEETETTMARCKARGGTAREIIEIAARAVARAEDAGKGADELRAVRALRATAWRAL
jgi:hypothetical protein